MLLHICMTTEMWKFKKNNDIDLSDDKEAEKDIWLIPLKDGYLFRGPWLYQRLFNTVESVH